MSNRGKWVPTRLELALAAGFLIAVVIVGYVAYRITQEPQIPPMDWSKFQDVPASESEMRLSELYIKEALYAIERSQESNGSLNYVSGSEPEFGYVTVVRAVAISPPHEVMYSVSFSDERPSVILEQYDGRTNVVEFKWSDRRRLNHFVAELKDCKWKRSGFGGGDFGLGGYTILYRIVEFEKVKPVLFAAF